MLHTALACVLHDDWDIAMAPALTNLPQDVLIHISLHLLIQDVLALMQVTRELFDARLLTR